MSDGETQIGRQDAAPIVLGHHLVGTQAFKLLFVDGMTLVEEAADYLDGEGRVHCQRLSRLGSLAYATESMRLTTRLIQLASWLLLQRAANDGEITAERPWRKKPKSS